MSTWRAWLPLLLGVVTCPPPALAVDQREPAASAGEELERQVIERFADLLARNPRRGTALDRVHDYQGGWPKAIGPLLAAAKAETSPAERRARQSILGERILSMEAGPLLRRTRAQGPDERYRALSDWVLPGAIHDSFRLQGEFTPDDPAPPVSSKESANLKGRRVHTGGEVAAPALDLVALAVERNELDHLAERVEQARPRSDLDRRGRFALLALIRAEQGRDQEAAAALGALQPLVLKLTIGDQAWTRWPELVATSQLVRRPSLRPAALALLDAIINEQVNKEDVPFGGHFRHLKALGQVLNLRGGRPETFGADPGLLHWAPVVHSRADDRGKGSPPAHWTFRDGQFTHYPGHSSDYLYFNVPLQGNFEVNCELTSFGWREARVSYGGALVGVQYDLKRADVIHYGRWLPAITIDPPLPPIGDWYKFRLAVRDGSTTVAVNGRQIDERSLSTTDPDPWLSLMAAAGATTGVRGLTITGAPTVPEVLKLSALPDLTGWLAEYYNEPLGGQAPAWEKKGEELYGRLIQDVNSSPVQPGRLVARTSAAKPAPFPSSQESVLQYHRPMLEDGEFAYEFFDDPGKVLVHPALDRLTFLLEPAGVSIHWMTDAQHERTDLLPDNRTVEADRRRGPGPLPLKPSAWNLLKLKVTGDTVGVFLNDTLVYERPLEPTNQRNVGLFHYADQTEARVRNVTYRGNWPRQLPRPEDYAARNAGVEDAKPE